MAQQLINIGTTANDGTGDTLRDAFDKVNDNTTELYTDKADAAAVTAAIATEASARAAADSALDTRVDALEAAPPAHAASHAAAGSDPLTLAQSQVTGLVADLAAKADASALTSEATTRAADDAALDARVDALEAGVAGGGTQSANTVLAGPTTGSAAAPTFRALVADDVPALAQAQVTGLVSDLAAKAPLAAPTFTGPVTVPTPSNATDAATKGYVDTAVAGVSGGGGGGSEFYTPDLTGPNDLDFATLGTTGGGTVVGSPTTAPSIVDNSLRVVGGTTNAIDAKAVEWPVPVGAFTVTVRIRRKAEAGGAYLTGIYLRANASGAGTFKGINVFNSFGVVADLFLGLGTYTTPTNRSAATDEVKTLHLPVYYLRATYNGTTIAFSWSATGHPDSFVPYGTAVAATTAIGAAPGRFGVYVDTVGTAARTMYVDWIDVT